MKLSRLLFLILALFCVGFLTLRLAEAQEGLVPCYGKIIIHETCDGLDQGGESFAIVGCTLVGTDTNSVHNCVAGPPGGSPINPPIPKPVSVCPEELNPISFCKRRTGVTAGNEMIGWCYQECGTSEIETGWRVKPIEAYGTRGEMEGTPECIPDVDEIWTDGGGISHVSHWDCYGHCANWILINEGVQVQIPGCAEDDSSDCRQPIF